MASEICYGILDLCSFQDLTAARADVTADAKEQVTLEARASRLTVLGAVSKVNIAVGDGTMDTTNKLA